jgi:diacylglycerol kinase (ATP)
LGKPGNTGILRVIRATRYSAQGLKQAWMHESAFRQEVTVTALLIPAGIWLGETPLEQLLLIGSCFFVLVVELLNSAVETAVDRISGESHELSGRAKDLGSAAVFLSLLMTGAVWGVVFWQRFMS